MDDVGADNHLPEESPRPVDDVDADTHFLKESPRPVDYISAKDAREGAADITDSHHHQKDHDTGVQENELQDLTIKESQRRWTWKRRALLDR